jgi:hypothetical protein
MKMENTNAQKEIVSLLIANEKILEKLYLVYAQKFPLFSNFWIEIAKEEDSHALWINTIFEKMKAGTVEFSQNRFPAEAIGKNIEYLKDKIEKLKTSEVTISDALEFSVHIEKGLLEHKFFEIFEEDSLELQMILDALRLGTEDHLRRIEARWKNEKLGANYENLKV